MTISKNQKGIADLFLVVVIVVIGIAGLVYFFWQRGLIKTTPIQQTSLTPITSIDETKSWKTYKNEEYGFELKYPNDWDYLVTKKSIPPQFSMGISPEKILNKDPSANFFITIIVDDYQSVNDHLNNLYCATKDCSLSAQDTYLGNLQAKKFDTELSSLRFRRVVTEQNQKTYELNILFYNLFENEYPFEERNTIFDNVLSTFRFLNSPAEYPIDSINVKFKADTDINRPEFLLPLELKTSVVAITPLFDLSEEELFKFKAEDLRYWFRIKLKPETNAEDFLNYLKQLDIVEKAEFAPLPVPPP